MATQTELTEAVPTTESGAGTEAESNPELETIFSDEQTRPFGDVDYHDRDAEMSARIDTLAEQLIEDAKQARESDAFRQWAETNGKFHNYSARNALLIQLQHPGAQRVAGFKQWQDDFDRHVQEGEDAIWILAYDGTKKVPQCPESGCDKSLWQHKHEDLECQYNATDDQIPDEDDDSTFFDEWDFNPYEKWDYVEKDQYKPVTVFAQEQTEGEPLPELPTEVTGNAELVEPIHAAATQAAHDVEIIPSAEWNRSSKGVCNTDVSPTEIRVEERTQAHTANVLIHEWAHAELHRKAGLDTKAKEVEAEGVAYIVGEHFGLESAGSGFYIASWANDTEGEIKKRLDRIKNTARTIIDAIEDEITT